MLVVLVAGGVRGACHLAHDRPKRADAEGEGQNHCTHAFQYIAKWPLTNTAPVGHCWAEPDDWPRVRGPWMKRTTEINLARCP